MNSIKELLFKNVGFGVAFIGSAGMLWTVWLGFGEETIKKVVVFVGSFLLVWVGYEIFNIGVKIIEGNK